MLKALFGDQPFFGGETAGVQTPVIQQNLVMTALVSSVAKPGEPIRILEVGSWTGFSALTWAHAIAMLHDAGGEVTCVDAWEPYFIEADIRSAEPVYHRMDSLARSGLAYNLFLHNASCGPKGVPITPLRGKSAHVLASLEPGRFDLIYIDGSHYYESVRADLIACRRLGGMLCGDDLELQVGEIARSEALGNIGRDCVQDTKGRWYHPGVTLAVHEILGEVQTHGRLWFTGAVDPQRHPMCVPDHWPERWKEKATGMLTPMTSDIR